ncbi:hypothetical protein J4225_04020 [Candidatus Pacearchaeota archaeon]|nr:hypothetical protein [Candidatus Pacearchaeota archaeon]
MLQGKRGWIRIVEAFVAILLITGVLLLVMNKGYIGKKDISGQVRDAEWAVLREIELNDNLRNEVLGVNIPDNPDENPDDNVPANVINKITNRIPNYLNCAAKICELDTLCKLNSIPNEALGKDIYAESIAITATSTVYNPRQLKMFCWVR